jgi:hypothetical protein
MHVSASRDTTMNTTIDAANARPTTVAFVNRFDAATSGRTVHLTPDEERRLTGTAVPLFAGEPQRSASA